MPLALATKHLRSCSGEWQNQHALSVNGKFSRITDEDVLLGGERYGIGTAPEVLAQVKSAALSD